MLFRDPTPAIWCSYDESPQKPTMGERRTLYGKETLTGADHPKAPAGRGQARLWLHRVPCQPVAPHGAYRTASMPPGGVPPRGRGRPRALSPRVLRRGGVRLVVRVVIPVGLTAGLKRPARSPGFPAGRSRCPFAPPPCELVRRSSPPR